MLAISAADFVLWLHVLAASIWIGGQLTAAVLLPMVRGQTELAAAAGRRFGWVAWIAFAVLILTGFVNMHNAGLTFSSLTATSAERTLGGKLVLVLISGLTAGLHSVLMARGTRSRMVSASLGSLSLASAVLAALFGVVIAQS